MLTVFFFNMKLKLLKLKYERNLSNSSVVYLTKENTNKTPEGEVLDALKLNKICCRRHMLTHVDIE